MNRRNFIRLAGGGTVAAAALSPLAGCVSSEYPAQAVEAWQGPLNSEPDARRFALAYAITAPNPHNLQPWIADLREPDVITIYTDPARVLPQTDPFGRQILIGHGAFLELLVLALAQRGLSSEVQLWPQGELPAQLMQWKQTAKPASLPIARIRLATGAQPSAQSGALFAQILKRRTPKTPFDTNQPVTSDSLAKLLASAGNARTAGGGTVEPQRLKALRELCWEAAQVELLTARTLMESVQLMRVGPAEILTHRDGISLNSPFVRTMSAVGMFDRSKPPAAGSAAEKGALERYESHTKTAMGFVWLTSGNTRSDQIEAGRQYVRLQLQATTLGLGMHPMSQALQEFAEMKLHYEREHQLVAGRPAPVTPQDTTVQMLCRIGYATTPAPATPRRALAQFIQAT